MRLIISDEYFFFQGLAKVASLSLSIGYPTIVSVPHSVVNGFKRLLALAAVTDITFKEAETLKEFLAVSLTSGFNISAEA